MDLNSRTAAFVLGVIFLIIGVLGYVSNPLVGPTGLFVTNNLHNLIHIISGIFLLIGVYTALGSSNALKILGVVYVIVAVLGFVLPMPDGMMLGMIQMGLPPMHDNLLHVVLAVVLLLAGFALPAVRTAAV